MKETIKESRLTFSCDPWCHYKAVSCPVSTKFSTSWQMCCTIKLIIRCNQRMATVTGECQGPYQAFAHGIGQIQRFFWTLFISTKLCLTECPFTTSPCCIYIAPRGIVCYTSFVNGRPIAILQLTHHYVVLQALSIIHWSLWWFQNRLQHPKVQTNQAILDLHEWVKYYKPFLQEYGDCRDFKANKLLWIVRMFPITIVDCFHQCGTSLSPWLVLSVFDFCIVCAHKDLVLWCTQCSQSDKNLST